MIRGAAPGDEYADYHRLQDQAMAQAELFPRGRFSGRGVVTVAGRGRYFTCAWVGLSLLRRALGCSLPIQLWYLGPDEMSPRIIELMKALDVECVDALSVKRRYPAGTLGGWECKPLAILHSRFQEVIFLDADNVPLADPGELLGRPEYRETGAIFWPDLGRLPPDHPIWRCCRVPYRDEPEFETGQVALDKARTWRALQLTMHLNDFSNFYYSYEHSDKETFRGNGLAMRAAMTLLGLAGRFRVSLLVVPLYSSMEFAIPDEVRALCFQALTLDLAPAHAERPPSRLRALLGRLGWRAAAGPPVAGLVPHEEFAVIHVFRVATLPFAAP